MDTARRTLVKALVWQALGLLVMALVGWGFTGSVALAGGMALANMAIGFASYFLHERIWARIGWGRMPQGERRGA
ncbi:DUF2061 domain-containing protein [Szabonella alba]|uniref:DUF2061 domain-containing protein n=1 Tax=Szabonella alba TaxID=2804194 RepID=A0A8K0VAS5_9RHOB|nr:DUF2061 domain-containing protein [Szabonella alba]MBL4916364.1 DUF2061 domain-containing protein [Szabonella alba]